MMPARLRARRWGLVGIALLAVVACVATVLVMRARAAVTVLDERAVGSHGVQLDARWYVPVGVDAANPAPAALLAHGLGGDLRDSDAMARMLARHGYVVRTWTSRGGRHSDGEVGIAGPDGEVADVPALLDDLARRPDVERDGIGDPRAAMVGVSHGAGVALLAAARDRRLDAIVSIYGWGSLRDALEPQAVRTGSVGDAAAGARTAGPGVLKLGWGSQLFAAAGSGARTGRPDTCGQLEHEVCDAWARAVDARSFDPADHELLELRSPLAWAADIEAPTLFVQGQMDSLFDLDQVVPLARVLRASGTPNRLEWVRAGHDAAPARLTQRHIDAAIRRWLDRHVRERRTVEVGPRFNVQLGADRGYAGTPQLPPRTRDRRIALEPEPGSRSGFLRLVTPPGGVPAETTTLPGLGDVTRFSASIEPPASQRARFRSAPIDAGLEIVGAPGVALAIRGSAPSGQLFVRLVDIGADGRELVPRGLVAPVRVDDVPPLRSTRVRAVRVRLPPIAWRVAPGHRLAVEVASTDAGYASPAAAPATWDVAIIGDGNLHVPLVRDPTRTAETFEAGVAPRTLAWSAAALVLLALLISILLVRSRARRRHRVQEPSLRDVPLVATSLAKRYGRRSVVRGIDLRVAPGSVVGLIGPNGAGKTTILRMVLGLVHPSDGAAWIFGQRVRPGIPHLQRVGALVEGPGLVPHRTLREHLTHHARATARDSSHAVVDAALSAVDLLDAADQPVRTASHGMRQRLGIAQALLGDPDLVVLDEPTNGLDPAQIRHLREIVTRIASDGRTVVVSSHLLHELERVCTHVALIANGAVLAAGPTADVIGEHADLEAAFLAATAVPDQPEDVHRA